MSLPNSTWNEIATTTIAKYSKGLADNITTHSPLLFRLNKKGNYKLVDGGSSILENLMYATNGTAKWYAGYEELSVAASDTLTSAEFEWKQYNVNVVISGEEKLKNSGSRTQVHNLLKSRIEVAEKTAKNDVSAALFYSNTENDGKSIGGLQHLVADAGTGTVGGIVSATETWWKNQVYSFGDDSTSASASTILHGMNQLWLNTVRNGDKPDLIVTGQSYYNYYEEAIQANQRFTDNEMADAGFENIKYKSAPVVYDSNCNTARMYFLNTDYIFFKPARDYNFVQSDQRTPVNQDALSIPMFWKGNMTVSNRNLQGILKA